ncbi:MAG: efflux RND transporter periplasmic adaptor subunit, partial [Moorea sp. SIO3C2]|nr:efflux RND transporter periplasmic adaptor subunit [Moorena sp. SIO3C2]
DRGDRVTQGTPIARLDIRNLEAERSQLEAQLNQELAVLAELQQGARQEDIDAAQSTVSDLENQLELQRIRQSRRQYLADEGAISREQLDEVAFGADALEDRLEAARSQLQELQTGIRPEKIAAQTAAVDQLTARIRNIDITIEKSTIFAPFDGVIGERQQDEGTVVGVGQAVVRLVESAQPEVEIGIPPKHLDSLALGQPQAVEIEGLVHSATVQSILPELDPTTRTRTVVLQLNGVNPSTIAPGQIARLNLSETIAETGYWLPTSALVQGEKGLWNAYAAVTAEAEDSNHQVERRLVEVLHTEGDRVFVRGTLNPDDLIITNGTQKLVPGQQVQPDVLN